MRHRLVGSVEEGVEERGFADIAATKEGYFGVPREWECAELGGAEEEMRLLGREEVAGVLELG